MSFFDILDKVSIEYSHVVNNKNIAISKLSHIFKTTDNSLAYFDGGKLELNSYSNCTLIVKPEHSQTNKDINYVICKEPKIVFYILAQNFAKTNNKKGIHSTAIIGNNCSISPTSYVGPYTVIEDNVTIKENCNIHGNTRIYSNSVIEKNVTIEANCAIGATGVFWTWDKNGKMWQLPQLGGVLIKSNSFLGTDITIVRAAYIDSFTTIGENCKIAHGSKLGHDCILENNVHFANNVTLGGGTTIKERCFVGSAATFRAGITIEKDNVIGAGAVVTKSFNCKKSLIIGFPAKEKIIDKKLSGMNDPLHRIK